MRKYVDLDAVGRRIPLPADAITVLSLAVALLGLFLKPPWAFILAVGALDVIDGAVARAHKAESKSGALLDSTLDRVVDAVILLYFDWPQFYALFAALLGTFLVSYVRARAESLGLAMRGVGFMERGERLLYLAAASLIGAPISAFALYLYAALVDVAAAYRFAEAYVALKGPRAARPS